MMIGCAHKRRAEALYYEGGLRKPTFILIGSRFIRGRINGIAGGGARREM